jgi:hypothetical protein
MTREQNLLETHKNKKTQLEIVKFSCFFLVKGETYTVLTKALSVFASGGDPETVSSVSFYRPKLGLNNT